MDKQYLLSRMHASLAMALRSDNAVARRIHNELARRYRLAAAAQDTDRLAGA